ECAGIGIDRMRRQFFSRECVLLGVSGNAQMNRLWRRDAIAMMSLGRGSQRVNYLVRQCVKRGLTRGQHKGIQVYQAIQPICYAVRNTANDQSCKTVTNEYDVSKRTIAGLAACRMDKR